MADSTLHALTETTTAGSAAELYTVVSPFGATDNRRLTIANLGGIVSPKLSNLQIDQSVITTGSIGINVVSGASGDNITYGTLKWINNILTLLCTAAGTGTARYLRLQSGTNADDLIEWDVNGLNLASRQNNSVTISTRLNTFYFQGGSRRMVPGDNFTDKCGDTGLAWSEVHGQKFVANTKSNRTAIYTVTATSTSAEMFINGTSTRLTIPASKTWAFRALVSAYQSAGALSGNGAAYEFSGMIKRDSANNTTMSSAAWVKTVLYEDDPTWDATIAADDTNEALGFWVTGIDAGTIRWAATVDITEAGGA
jgi:hypothetical protein